MRWEWSWHNQWLHFGECGDDCPDFAFFLLSCLIQDGHFHLQFGVLGVGFLLEVGPEDSAW